MTIYRRSTLEQAAQLITMLGGCEKVAALLDGLEGVKFKYGQYDFGQLEVILNKIIQAGVSDQDILGQLLRDELEIQLVAAIKKFFAQHGRRIPPQGMKASHTDPNRNFHLVQPKLDTVEDMALRLVRFQENIQPGPIMSAAEFQGKVNELLAALRADELIANLANGVCLPIILPQIKEKKSYGLILEETFVKAAKQAYEKEFPGRTFNNYRAGELDRQVTIVDKSHQLLIERLFQSHLVALYFPNPLQGFSVQADREQMDWLPSTLHLTGGFDTLTGVAMYPDVLGRDFHIPGLDMAALQWRDAEYSLYFEAYDDFAYFDCEARLGDARGNYSGGLLFFLE